MYKCIYVYVYIYIYIYIYIYPAPSPRIHLVSRLSDCLALRSRARADRETILVGTKGGSQVVTKKVTTGLIVSYSHRFTCSNPHVTDVQTLCSHFCSSPASSRDLSLGLGSGKVGDLKPKRSRSAPAGWGK